MTRAIRASVGPAHLARQRTLAESLGGTYHQVIGDDIPHALLASLRSQLLLSISSR
jgi:two-component system sensor histidine kinase KdpD